MRLAKIKADFDKRIAIVEAELENIQGYPALQKALGVSSGAVYAVLGLDIDTMEGMEMLLHSLKTDDIYFYSIEYETSLDCLSIVDLLTLEQAARDFYTANRIALEVTMDRNVLVQYDKYIEDIKSYWLSIGGTY